MKVNNQLLRKTKVNNTEVNNQLLEISQIERGYLTSESGVMVGNTLTSNKITISFQFISVITPTELSR